MSTDAKPAADLDLLLERLLAVNELGDVWRMAAEVVLLRQCDLIVRELSSAQERLQMVKRLADQLRGLSQAAASVEGVIRSAWDNTEQARAAAEQAERPAARPRTEAEACN